MNAAIKQYKANNLYEACRLLERGHILPKEVVFELSTYCEEIPVVRSPKRIRREAQGSSLRNGNDQEFKKNLCASLLQ